MLCTSWPKNHDTRRRPMDEREKNSTEHRELMKRRHQDGDNVPSQQRRTIFSILRITVEMLINVGYGMFRYVWDRIVSVVWRWWKVNVIVADHRNCLHGRMCQKRSCCKFTLVRENDTIFIIAITVSSLNQFIIIFGRRTPQEIYNKWIYGTWLQCHPRSQRIHYCITIYSYHTLLEIKIFVKASSSFILLP